MNRSTRRSRGFTLVELLIVAIILAILAAIVVPQFASTTNDAEESALRANLAAVRSALDLYRQQHGEYPGVSASSGGACTGTAGTGAAGNVQAVIDQLTRYTNQSGQSCSAPDAGYVFGPYLKEDALPDNPVTNSSAVAIVTSGDLNMAADGAGLGWKYDSTSGKFIANDSNTDGNGDAYATY